MKESNVLKTILLKCGTGASRLFRANVGLAWAGDAKVYHRRQQVTVNAGDVVIRNAHAFRTGIKGMSDLIGWRTVTVTPAMVGQKVAVYAAVEVKTETGRVRPEQINFIDNVNEAGGIAGVARSADEAERLLSCMDN